MCSGFYESLKSESDKKAIEQKYTYLLVFQTFRSIPFSIFSSFIVINLTFRSFIDLVDYVLRYLNRSSTAYYDKLFTKSKDSFCCDLFNVRDEHEIIYSQCDIDYVLNLLNGSESLSKRRFYKIKKHRYLTACEEGKRNFQTKLASTLKSLIDWDSNFRFSSRVINTLTVSFVALYYFVLIVSYFISYSINYYASFIPTSFDPSKAQIPLGYLLCQILEYFLATSSNSCSDSVWVVNVDFLVPDKLIQSYPWLRDSIVWLFMTPLIVSPIICMCQIYLFSHDLKTHLKQLYKGEYDFVRKAKNIGNATIASGSFHFGG